MVISPPAMLVITRGYPIPNPIKSHETTIFCGFSYGFSRVPMAFPCPMPHRIPWVSLDLRKIHQASNAAGASALVDAAGGCCGAGICHAVPGARGRAYAVGVATLRGGPSQIGKQKKIAAFYCQLTMLIF